MNIIIIIWKNTSTNINIIIIFFQNLSFFFIIHSDQGPGAHWAHASEALRATSRRFRRCCPGTTCRAAASVVSPRLRPRRRQRRCWAPASVPWQSGKSRGEKHEERWGINGKFETESLNGDLGVPVLCNHHQCVGGWMVRPSKMLIEEIYWSLFGSPFSWFLKGGFPG